MTARPWIVVLNWHGREDTLELLSTLAPEPVEIVVVDNGSYDGALEEIATAYPAVHTVQTGRNLGYAGGNNVGIEYALERGAEVVGVLNNDTVVTAGFTGPLLAALDAHPTSAVSPDIRYADGSGISWWRGSRWDERRAWMTHVPPDQQNAKPDAFLTEALSGCCIFATASVWRQVGLFDDGLFLIFEDADWSARATAAGIQLRAIPASRIEHKVSSSFTGDASLVGTYFFTRNGLVVTKRHHGLMAMLRFLLWTVLPHHLGFWRSRERLTTARLAWRGMVSAVVGDRGPMPPSVQAIARRAPSRHR